MNYTAGGMMQSHAARRLILSTVILFFLAALVSRVAGQNATPDVSADAAGYCTKQGGKVVIRYPALRTSTPKEAVHFAGVREFCEFKDKDGGLASLPIGILYADQPTLAVLAYLTAPAFKPVGSTANPSYFYCQQLNGAINFGTGGESGWVNNADPQDIINPCVFADGSMIDAWTVFYKSDSTIRGVDLTKHFRWTGSRDLMDIFK
jgi:putative hemolysin